MNQFKFKLMLGLGIIIMVSLSTKLFLLQTNLGEVLEKFELNGAAFTISVISHSEKGIKLLGGAYYTFKASPNNLPTWTEIMTIRLDDPDPIPREQIRIINEKIGYVFMLNKYAVTIDGGINWFVWSVKDFPKLKDTFAIIKKVELDSNGYGKMSIRLTSTDQVFELSTKDYGQHWIE